MGDTYCTQFYTNLTVQTAAEFYLRPYTNYGSHFTSFYETQNYLVTLCVDLLHQLSRRSIKKYGNVQVEIIYAPKLSVTVTELTVKKLACTY